MPLVPFTPDNDGHNDAWRMFTSGAVTRFEIKIYDRWGAWSLLQKTPRNTGSAKCKAETISTRWHLPLHGPARRCLPHQNFTRPHSVDSMMKYFVPFCLCIAEHLPSSLGESAQRVNRKPIQKLKPFEAEAWKWSYPESNWDAHADHVLDDVER